MSFAKQKYKFWALGIVVGVLMILIQSIFAKPDATNRTVITVNAPEAMHIALESTLKNTKLDRKYLLEFTNSSDANFVVTEGANATGELIAYSPIIAVFNSDKDLYQQYCDQEVFVQSNLNDDYTDFDFKKIIDNIASGQSDLKVYYPAKNSTCWDEFYSFLLFTVNDGYYPKTTTDTAEASKKIEQFLSSKNTEAINNATLERSNGIPKNSIYFMTYVDLVNLYKNSGLESCRIMYPKTVVYHNYRVNFDETGNILFDALKAPEKGFFATNQPAGYAQLYYSYYNTTYTTGTSSYSDNIVGKRNAYNGVEIPEISATQNNVEEGE